MRLQLPILMYHEVKPNIERIDKNESAFKGRCLSAYNFERQMRYLYENGYECVTFDDTISFSERKRTNKKKVIITFDDGYTGNYLYALPILKKYGFKATFFVIVDWIGQDNMLTWEQIIDLKTSGMSIQSHTLTHTPLQYLSIDEIRDEMMKSKVILEKRIEDKVDFLSLPHGRYNDRVLKIAREVGYRNIFTSDIDFTFNMGKFAHGRIEIFENYTLHQFTKITQANHLMLATLKIKKSLGDVLKKILGFRNYRKISTRILPRDLANSKDNESFHYNPGIK